MDLKIVVDELKKHCSLIKLKRSDENEKMQEASFFVEFDDFEKLEETKKSIQKIYPQISIVFMDNTRDF